MTRSQAAVCLGGGWPYVGQSTCELWCLEFGGWWHIVWGLEGRHATDNAPKLLCVLGGGGVLLGG